MAQGVGVSDIYGITEAVEIRPGTSLEFKGWSSRAVASLLNRFPVLADTVMGKPLTIGRMKEMDPLSVGAMLAAGIKGGLDNKEMEEALADLPLQTQMDCFKAIRKVTWPKGYGPFLADLFGVPPPTSNGRGEQASGEQDTNSQKPSSDSEAMPTEQSGISPPAN